MSQSWTADLYTTSTVANTTLNNMELMFATLRSSFSGASAPGSAVAGQVWYDTTQKILKHRNNASSAWRGVLAGSNSLKLWLYLNAAEEGWAVDGSVTDNVLALKGGSAYSAFGANKGSWTISGVTVDGHAVSANEMPAHTHEVPITQPGITSGAQSINYPLAAGETEVDTRSTGGGATHTHGLTIGSAYRPLAAVGTLQYPDV